MAILKRLSASSFGYCGQRVNIKASSVDLPINPQVFHEIFELDYKGENDFKATVRVSDLDKVFGSDWHILNFASSFTRKRILGNVSLHYRKKTLVKNDGNDHRYICVCICI